MSSAVFLMVIAIVIVGVGLLVVITLTRRPAKQLNKDAYRAKWLQITNQLRDEPAVLHMAIMQADSLLDRALRERGVAGNNLGERLKNGKAHFRDINGVWQAHKLRNRVAHEDNVRLDIRQTKTALNLFKAALTDLGAF